MVDADTPATGRRAFILRRSLKLRIVAAFVLLAVALMMLFWLGAQRMMAMGWREAAQPLLTDYVDHLAADIVVEGTPRIARAQALVERLPLTVEIRGPVVNWFSHPGQGRKDEAAGRQHERRGYDSSSVWARMFWRSTPDGHQIRFGIDREVFGPRRYGFLMGLTLLLGLTFLAWLYVRRQLAPLDAIGAGAERFGRGDFAHPIPAAQAERPDELGRLAATVNTMGEDIRQMLDAKRALLLAISHELRSPLTRARLHAELLPEDDPLVQPQRAALLHDVQEMSRLITDLLESERLAGRHVVMQREAVDPAALVASVRDDLMARHPAVAGLKIDVLGSLPAVQLDAARVRLLVRNLLDNALRYGTPGQVGGTASPELRLRALPSGGVMIEVRDFGPGVPEDQLPRLAQPFYRPDPARSRRTGGIGLGFYLCRLVAEAHGGYFEVENASPGLRVRVSLPGSPVDTNDIIGRPR